MKVHKIRYIHLCLVLSIFFVYSPASLAAKNTSSLDESSINKEIKVRLLGDTCNLVGPFSESTLKTIHAIGPAQIEIDAFTQNGKDKARKLLESFRSAGKILQDQSTKAGRALDDYVSRQCKRLEGLIAYYEGIDLLQKTSKKDEFLKKVTPFLRAPDAALEKLAVDLIKAPQGSTSRKELGGQLFDTFSGLLDDPEKEFHRVIRQLKVQYNCFFEAADTNPEE
ncbi:MAG: hypothetical protein HYX41_05665 [Bdellovibrio sp.]|nr:hypothetical protein [Bdellovibrio sp.]